MFLNAHLQTWLQSYKQKIFCFHAKFYRFFMWYSYQKFQKIILWNLPQLAAPKNLHRKFYYFTEKNLRFQNFQAFYRKIYRLQNILDRIKPRAQEHTVFYCLIYDIQSTSEIQASSDFRQITLVRFEHPKSKLFTSLDCFYIKIFLMTPKLQKRSRLAE